MIENLLTKATETEEIKLYISGNYEQISQICQEYCMTCGGLCVTVSPVDFIYTGGREKGVVIGFLNYPKYPSSYYDLVNKTKELGLLLLERTFVDSFLFVLRDKTVWVDRNRKEKEVKNV